MKLKIVHKILFYVFTCVFAFDDLLSVYGQGIVEMSELGKQHYQVLQERGNLPHYGQCWQSALDHVHESCRELNEDTQSDVALHLTNCFLQMSGHETYNCEHDKKHNLRAICINNMSDRAFMVYTEFYTQIINICWFLRGQVWNEIIAENSVRLIDYMKISNKNQEQLIRAQEKSLDIQQRLLNYEQQMEEFMTNFHSSTEEYQKVLYILNSSVRNLQNWLIGEVSWFDSIVFYLSAVLIVFIFTATKRTYNARLIMLFLLALNIFIERLIATKVLSNSNQDAHVLHENYYTYIWYCRNVFIVLSIVVLCTTAYFYKDYAIENNTLLNKLYKRNNEVYDYIKVLQNSNNTRVSSSTPDKENVFPLVNNVDKYLLNGYVKNILTKDASDASSSKLYKNSHNMKISSHVDPNASNDRYNLRSRHATPEVDSCSYTANKCDKKY